LRFLFYFIVCPLLLTPEGVGRRGGGRSTIDRAKRYYSTIYRDVAEYFN